MSFSVATKSRATIRAPFVDDGTRPIVYPVVGAYLTFGTQPGVEVWIEGTDAQVEWVTLALAEAFREAADAINGRNR